VDFRLQKLGIGRLLLNWGIELSTQSSLPIMTEASIEGSKFYEKFGLEKVGDWTVHMPNPKESVTLAVMKRNPE